MTTDADEDFDALAEVWRQERAPDASGLRRGVRRADIFNRLALVAEISVGVAGLAAGAWLLYHGNWIIGIAACLFAAFGSAVSITTRAIRAERHTRSVTAALQAALEQANRQYRAGIGGLWVCAAALLFAAVVALDALGDSPTGEALVRLVRVQAAAAILVALGVLVAGSGLVRASRRRAALSQLQASIGQPRPDSHQNGLEAPRDQR